MNPSERSKCSRSSGENYTLRTGRDCEKKTTSQENARGVKEGSSFRLNAPENQSDRTAANTLRTRIS